jgi:hypothetical protein
MLTPRNISKLQPFSVGIVAVNKLPSEHHVEVVPLETASFMEGELTDFKDEYKGSGKDKDGRSFSHDIDLTLSVRAKWLPFCQGNRITPPDVRRGEHVMLYQLGDADEYYWVTLRQDKHLRRLETVIYSYSNNRDEDIEDDPETTYWFEVSTHKKLIHLHTSKNDKEPFTYDVQINTKDGRIIVEDDDMNYLFLDSKERHWRIHNKDETYIELDKRIINMHSHDEINMTTTKYTLTAKESMDIKTKRYNERCDDYTMEAEESITTETKEEKVGNEKYILHTKEEYRHKIEGHVLFETPRWEYKVITMKFKIKNKFHAQIDPSVEIEDNNGDGQEPPELKFLFGGAPIDHDNIITTTYVEGPAVVPPVEIKAKEVEKSDVEPEETEDPKEVPAL